MKLSAELRWFWRNQCPDLFDWFVARADHGFAAGGGAKTRADDYLADAGQVELGIKIRGDVGSNAAKPAGPEIKGLIDAAYAQCDIRPFSGAIEFWSKWDSRVLEVPPSKRIRTLKTRWLRKFESATGRLVEIELDEKEDRRDRKDLPGAGCNVELTEVRIEGETWWTFGFESFGPVSSLNASLLATAGLLAARQPPAFEAGVIQSYPKWLASRVPAKAVQDA